MTHRPVLAVLSLLALAACAPLHKQVPAYPAQRQSLEQQATDVRACEAWAKDNTNGAGASAGVGAGVGAVIGAGVGAVFGAVIFALFHLDPADGAAFGASIGGLSGATQGAAAGAEGSVQTTQRAYAVCMASRGYAV